MTGLEPVPGQGSPEELLADLLGPGPGTRERCRALLADGLAALGRRSAEELQVAGGLSLGRARMVAAAFALGRAVERLAVPRDAPLSSPAAVHRLLAPELRGLERETFCTLFLDARHRPIGRPRWSEGTLTTSLVHPREVFAPALRRAAAAVVVAHNHPSGDPEPSAEDEAVTRRLLEAGQLLGVPLLDHVVIGRGAWVSMRARMDFGNGAYRVRGV